jgi:uncharacterized membrane protein
MVSAHFPLPAFIGLLGAGFIIVPFMIWARRHMLHKTQPHPTVWNKSAATAFTVSGVLVTMDAVLILVYAVNEARLTAKYPEAEDMGIVAKGLDTPFARIVSYLTRGGSGADDV